MFQKTESRMVATYIGLNVYRLRIRWFFLGKRASFISLTPLISVVNV
jgi:hypothetical protein